MSSTQNLYFNLNINPQVESAPPVVHVSQYDNTSRQVIFSMYDDDAVYNIPSDVTARVEGTKGDNTGFSYECSHSGNKVTVVITEQMTVMPGRVMCEIILDKGDQFMGSANFFLAVEPSAMRTDVKLSETDIPALRLAIKYSKQMENDADRADKSAAAAKVSETNAAKSATDSANSAAASKASATASANSATAALNSQNAAKASKDAAKASETASKASEEASKQSEDNSAANAKLSESWAVGGTGTRDGEDTDNSKYYASQSSDSADASKTAQNGAETAESNANDAMTVAQTAQQKAEESQAAAKTSETNAAISETNAKTSETNAETSATKSESYAVGGTASRDGEDEDNSKYYSEQALNSASAAANSEVDAKASADSAKENADAIQKSATLSESYTKGGTGTRDGEDTDNAKYYMDRAREIANSDSYVTLVNGKVPSEYLPSYVDDVIEYDNKESFPAEGESGKIYVAKDLNESYRWTGSTYVRLDQSAESSDYSKSLKIVDMTSDETDEVPSWYLTNFPGRVIYEEKKTTTVGLVGKTVTEPATDTGDDTSTDTGTEDTTTEDTSTTDTSSSDGTTEDTTTEDTPTETLTQTTYFPTDEQYVVLKTVVPAETYDPGTIRIHQFAYYNKGVDDTTHQTLTYLYFRYSVGVDAWSVWSLITKSVYTKEDVGLDRVNNTPDSEKNVRHADNARLLEGFSTYAANWAWGNQVGTEVWGANDSTGGSLGFRRDNPQAGKISMLINGTVYVNEGADEVATKKNLQGYLPISGGTVSGDISFAPLDGSTTSTGTSKGLHWRGGTDGADIYYNVASGDQGNLVLNTIDDANAYIQFANNGTVHSYISPADGVYHGDITGNAGSVNGRVFNWSGKGGQPTWLWGSNDSIQQYVYNPSNFWVDKANKVNGSYSGNGGQQGPGYFGRNNVGFIMSNQNVRGDANYKNWIYMDNYSGDDVGGATAIGVDRQTLRAFIMRSDASRSAWNESTELVSYNNVSETAAGGYVVQRSGSGYIYATYFNQSSGAETPNSSSYIMFCNSDGFLRKSSIANIKNILGVGITEKTVSSAYNFSTINTNGIYIVRASSGVSFSIKGNRKLITVEQSKPVLLFVYGSYKFLIGYDTYGSGEGNVAICFNSNDWY